MITICTKWEYLQMAPELEWSMWRQLKGAFNIDKFIFSPVIENMKSCPISQYDTMEEALSSCVGRLVFLEPWAKRSLSEVPQIHEEPDICFVLSNTSQSNQKFVDNNDYRIRTPKNTDLYGINAAAIALSHYHRVFEE